MPSPALLVPLELPSYLPYAVLKASLDTLVQAHRCATALKRTAWQWSVPREALVAVGLSDHGFHWFLTHHFLWQAAETTPPVAAERTFVAADRRQVDARGCFLLSGRGAQLACDLGLLGVSAAPVPSAAPDGDSQARPLRPRWRPEQQELHLGEYLIKVLSRAAPNQGSLLDGFEAAQWPSWIANVLPDDLECERVERTHNTLNSLNKNQLNPWLSFGRRGDKIGWKFTTCKAKLCRSVRRQRPRIAP